ncbi:hypothetical protein Tco_1420074 [Tanacetum coccineum]
MIALTESTNVLLLPLIEQFWNSVVSQTVNNVSQIKANVSGHTVLILESSIRRDLLFNDDNGIDCLTVADIYENLPLMGTWRLRRNSYVSKYHAAVKEGEWNTLEGTGRSEGDQVQLPYDSPLLGGHTSDRVEGSLNLKELFVHCTNLSNRVLALETSKDAQAVEILKLKTSIKKLEKKYIQEAEREQFTVETKRAKILHDTIALKEVLIEQRAVELSGANLSLNSKLRRVPGQDSTILKMKARKKARKQTHADSDASKKKKGSPRMKRMSKRKKTDSDLEEEEHLKTFLKIVPDEKRIGIYYMIFRSDGSSRWIKTFSEMVTRFDRLDLVELYNLDITLANQERWILKSWDFYKNCGFHTLILEDGTEIHMLVERKYPLTKETLEKMMSLKLVDWSSVQVMVLIIKLRSIQADDES